MNIHFNNFNGRKAILLLLVVFALLTPIVIISFSSSSFDSRSSANNIALTEELKKADLNSDKVINLDDFRIWLDHFNKVKRQPTYFINIADVNVDKKIDLYDFSKWLELYRKYVNLVVAGGTPTPNPTPAPSQPTNPNPTAHIAYTGTGKDGSVTVSTSMGPVDLNRNKVAPSRNTSCPDAINYSVASFAADGKSLNVTEAIQTACLTAGDEILIINLQGTMASVMNVGNWETLIVESINGQKITFKTKKTKFYGNGVNDDSGIGVQPGTQKVMVQRVPNYQNVTIDAGATLTVSPFDRKKGGVLFFRVKGALTVGGTLSAAGKGYMGGVGDTNFGTHPSPGDSLFVDLSTKSGHGGIQGNPNGNDGTYSGGGGGASHNESTGTFGKGHSGILASGGGGAGGEAISTYSWFNLGHSGSGGGGGHATGGTTGVALQGDDWVGCKVGENGNSAKSGNGGSAYHRHNPEGRSIRISVGGAGGGGSSKYASGDLAKLHFGSGGGAGGTSRFNAIDVFQEVPLKGGNGGGGGGIIYVSASTISVSGFVTASGADGEHGRVHSIKFDGRDYPSSSGGGGAGAGGSIRFEASSGITMGEKRVLSVGGTGGKQTYCGGGNGGVGVVALYSKTISGVSNPTARSVAY